MAIAVGTLDPGVYDKYKSFADVQTAQRNNALLQQTAQIKNATDANIYKTQVLSAAAGSGNPDVVNAALQHLNDSGIDTSDVPTDLPSLTKYTDAARLAQSPLGSLLGAGLKAEGNLNQAAGITGNTGTAGGIDPLSASIAAKLGGFTGNQPAANIAAQPAAAVAAMPANTPGAPIPNPPSAVPLPQPDNQGVIAIPAKPVQVAAIDGTAPAVNISQTPTQSIPIYTPSPQQPGETQAAYQARKAGELEQFKINNAAALKQQDSQASTTGELNAKDIESAAKADQLTKRLEMNLNAMLTLNPNVPSSGILPGGAHTYLSQVTGANPGLGKAGIGDNGAGATASNQWDQINNQQVLSEIQQFLAAGGANTRINQTLDKIAQAASGIDKNSLPGSREAQIKNALAEIQNKNVSVQNLVGGNQQYQPIPVTQLPMGSAAAASQQQFNAQKGVVPYTAYFGGQ